MNKPKVKGQLSKVKSLGGTQGGLSVLETVIYISLFVFVFAFVIQGILGTYGTIADIRLSRSVNQAAHSALERMTRDSRDALSVDTINSVLEQDPGTLVLETRDSFGGDVTRSYYVDSDDRLALRSESDSGIADELLTPSNVSVTGLLFKYATTTNSELIRIELEITNNSGRRIVTEEYQSSVVVRGSY